MNNFLKLYKIYFDCRDFYKNKKSSIQENKKFFIENLLYKKRFIIKNHVNVLFFLYLKRYLKKYLKNNYIIKIDEKYKNIYYNKDNFLCERRDENKKYITEVVGLYVSDIVYKKSSDNEYIVDSSGDWVRYTSLETIFNFMNRETIFEYGDTCVGRIEMNFDFSKYDGILIHCVNEIFFIAKDKKQYSELRMKLE